MQRPIGSRDAAALVCCAVALATVIAGLGGGTAVAGATAPIGGTSAASTSGEPPLADAGLDQTVTPGSTVHLDGSASRATGGEIRRYEWVVTDASGEETIRTGSATPTATFEAESLGGYEVTLVVTDDDGRASSDTLYVDVEPRSERSNGEGDAAVDPESIGPDATIVDTHHRRLVDVTVRQLVVERRTVSTTVASAASRDRAFRMGFTVADTRVEPIVAVERRVSGGDVTGNDATGNDATGNDATGNDATGNDATGNDATGNDATGNHVPEDDWVVVHETTDVRKAALAKQHDDLRVDYDTGKREHRWTMERLVEVDRGYVDEVGEEHDHVRTDVTVDAELVGVVEGTDERVELGVHEFAFRFEEHRSGTSLREAVRTEIDRRNCEVDGADVRCGGAGG
ncbi:PKD domain-containing protein [Halorubrum sp. DTA98]|uniref:PKD domain-containing protein n=1 Tax=Halorubrum sp. DTA98 TaxID=3402163 RepID=UPI003AAFA0CE